MQACKSNLGSAQVRFATVLGAGICEVHSREYRSIFDSAGAGCQEGLVSVVNQTFPFVLQLWRDYQLTWDPIDYGGITTIRILPHKVWKPDIVLFNK